MVGIYYKTVSRNWENGYTVFLVNPSESCPYAADGLVKCSGHIGIYIHGTPVSLDGEYDEEKKEFIVSSDTVQAVNTKENTILMLEYITDELTEKQKDKIAEVAENDLFLFVSQKGAADKIMDVIKDKKRAAKLAKLIIRKVKKLKEQEEFAKKMIQYNIPVKNIETLIKKELFFDVLDKDPYITMLKFEIPIDSIEMYVANRLKINEYHVVRLSGFLYDAMQCITHNGNTCATIGMIVKTMNMRLKKYGIYKTIIDEAAANMCIHYLSGEIEYHEIDGIPYVYFRHVWQEENASIRHILRLQNKTKQYCYDLASVDDIETETGIIYNSGQRAAFQMLKTSGIKILTGPPGSGKTAVLKGLMRYFVKNKNGNVRLAATTGMASKVMAEACNDDAETVNLMLNVRPYENTIEGRNLNNPVEEDFVIVDEVSMLGLQLFSVLAGAIKNDSILLLVGDENQLQSVDYGNVLHDLIASGVIEVCRLTEILRQSGSICSNAKKINAGQHCLEINQMFNIKKFTDTFQMIDDLKSSFKKNESQIICPTRIGTAGTIELNEIFQDETASIVSVYGRKTFRLGDKIIMTKTDYDAGYINGDMGYIIGKNDDSSICVEFSSKILNIPRKNLSDMELGDAITIHKSQGSEFDDMHIILPSNAAHMITRRILYTGVTRAKHKVSIYEVEDMVDVAIDNTSERERVTLLDKRLLEAQSGLNKNES